MSIGTLGVEMVGFRSGRGLAFVEASELDRPKKDNRLRRDVSGLSDDWLDVSACCCIIARAGVVPFASTSFIA